MSDTKVEVKKQEAKTGTPAPMRPAMPDVWQSLHDDMEQMLDGVSRGFGLRALRRMFDVEPGWRGAFSPSAPPVDVTEDETSFHITAELPGMSEKDIDVTIANDTVTIKGEKREEKETKDKNYFLSERRFGSFQRAFPLPKTIDRDKIAATFDKGMLTLILPKAPEAVSQQKKIAITAK